MLSYFFFIQDMIPKSVMLGGIALVGAGLIAVTKMMGPAEAKTYVPNHITLLFCIAR